MVMNASQMGKKGGKARAKGMTAEERRASAAKAGRASARARKKKARDPKEGNR